jgi:hypothetical protein
LISKQTVSLQFFNNDNFNKCLFSMHLKAHGGIKTFKHC